MIINHPKPWWGYIMYADSVCKYILPERDKYRIQYLLITYLSLIVDCSMFWVCPLLRTVVHIISQETREGYIASMLKMLRIYSETHTNTNLFRSLHTNLVLRAIMKWKKWDENKICHKITNWYTWNCSGSGEEILLSASRLTQFLNLILLEKQPPQFFYWT